MNNKNKYTSNLKRAGAAIEDSLELLRHWTDEIPELELRKKLVLENVLAKKSYRRRKDFLDFIFLPRYIRAYPEGHWKYLQILDKVNIPYEVLTQLLYFYTALNEPFIPYFINNYLLPRYEQGIFDVTTNGTSNFIRDAIHSGDINVKWTESVLSGVVTGLLNALAGFGILQGKVKRTIAPTFIQLPAFYYISFFIHSEGFSGEKILKHDYWKFFLLNEIELRHLFLEAHQQKYLWYEEISNIFKVSFFEHSFEEVVNVIIKRTT